MTKDEFCRKIIDLHKETKRTYIYCILNETINGINYYGIEISCPETADTFSKKKLTRSRSKAEEFIDHAASSFLTPLELKNVRFPKYRFVRIIYRLILKQPPFIF